MQSGKKPFAAAVVLMILIFCTGAFAQKPTVWGDLEQGPYGVGFITLERFDYSRVFRASHDYLGNPVEGERHRPIQACFWYPAVTNPNDITLTYAEYAFPYPQDNRFFNLLSALQDREMSVLFGIFRDQEAVLRISSTSLGSVRDAIPPKEVFPLLIYIPDRIAGFAENAVMCEYLASHGYIVMTTPSLGTNSANPEMTAIDLENIVRDKEFALAMIQRDSLIEYSHLAVFGHGFGGLAALNLAMRNPDIEAVLSLQGTFTQADMLEFCRQSPAFSVDRMTADLIAIYTDARGKQDLSLFNELEFADRISIGASLFTGREFSDYVMFSESDSENDQVREMQTGYQDMCRLARAYFDTRLKNQGKFMPVLKNTSIYETIQFSSSLGNDIPPTQEQFVRILAGGNIDTALAIYDKYHELYPDRLIVPEGTINMLGYRTLASGRVEAAIRLFKMNTEAFPNSSNTWDSLSDGYLAAGDTEKAAECMRKVLETLPIDSTTDAGVKENIRNKCEHFLDSLQQSSN